MSHLTERELDKAIKDMERCRMHQGHGPNPKRATLLDFLLAVGIVTGLFFAVVAWTDEPDPNAAQAKPTRRVTT